MSACLANIPDKIGIRRFLTKRCRLEIDQGYDTGSSIFGWLTGLFDVGCDFLFKGCVF